jgi:ATP:cob(I)alamin adenosyltransferase
VVKDDIRIETNGEIDQLNAILGIIRSKICADDPRHAMILKIQRELMVVMSHVATPDGETNPKALHSREIVEEMERMITESTAPACFVIPGENELSSFLHLARTQTRTVERRLWTLCRTHLLDSQIPVFVNRLSDYLFVCALETTK